MSDHTDLELVREHVRPQPERHDNYFAYQQRMQKLKRVPNPMQRSRDVVERLSGRIL